MSSYYRLICSLLLVSGIHGFGGTLSNAKEDVFTLVGLDRELNSDYATSVVLFEQLFKDTNNTEYLKKSIELYYANKEYQKVIDLSKKHIENISELQEYLMYKYVLSNMILKKYDDAFEIAKTLEQKNLPENSGLIGDLYYLMNDYKSALQNYEFGYETTKTSNLVLAIANLYYTKLDNKAKAISYLKEYTTQNGCDKKVCIKLLEYYQSDNNLDGMIEVMESMYVINKAEHTGENLAKFEMMMAQLYMQKDKQKGIDFLLQTGNNNLFVAIMYEQEKEYEKALRLLYKMFQETKDQTLLGRIAMNEFTIAKDKKKVINEVLTKFELALETNSNSEYENFYGYLLIDYDLDVKKGLELVKKAYETDSNNIAIIDSLAWGYFKNNQCKEAKKYMDDVVNKVGLDDEEIRLHHNEIKDCIEGKK